MTVGSLRDQVIYPHTKEEQVKRGISDTKLLEILDKVQLSYILEREGGWDSVQVNLFYWYTKIIVYCIFSTGKPILLVHTRYRTHST